MATKKVLTKEEILESLKKNKITNLEQFIEALLPNETGGYTVGVAGMAEELTIGGSLMGVLRSAYAQDYQSSEAMDARQNWKDFIIDYIE